MVPGEKDPESRWATYKNPYMKEDLFDDQKDKK